MHKIILRGRREGQFRAQELVEFALVLPVLLMLLFGAVDLGRVFHAAIAITNVARVGARFGINWDWTEAGGYTAIVNAARAEASGSGLDPAGIAVTPNCGSCGSRDDLSVSVQYTFDLLIGELLGLPELTLGSGAVMTIP